ncbi:MAG: hypothetical protein ABIZ18_06620, partial [Caldimonas sp.]
ADAKPDDAQAQPDAKAEAKPKAEDESKPAPEAKPPTDLTPQLVERVHRLYEELGRQDVQAVEALEKSKLSSRDDEPRK